MRSAQICASFARRSSSRAARAELSFEKGFHLRNDTYATDSARLERARHNLIVECDYVTGLWTVFLRSAVERYQEALNALYRLAGARRSFPNHKGNYVAKREPRPLGRPIEPRERFARLQADYLSHAMTYRNPPTKHDVRFKQHAA